MRDLKMLGDGSPINNIAHMEAIADDITPDYEYSRDLSDEELDNERLEFAASVQIKSPFGKVWLLGIGRAGMANRSPFLL